MWEKQGAERRCVQVCELIPMDHHLQHWRFPRLAAPDSQPLGRRAAAFVRSSGSRSPAPRRGAVLTPPRRFAALPASEDSAGWKLVTNPRYLQATKLRQAKSPLLSVSFALCRRAGAGGALDIGLRCARRQQRCFHLQRTAERSCGGL